MYKVEVWLNQAEWDGLVRLSDEDSRRPDNELRSLLRFAIVHRTPGVYIENLATDHAEEYNYLYTVSCTCSSDGRARD